MESGDEAASSVGEGAEPVEDVNDLISAVSSNVEGGEVKGGGRLFPTKYLLVHIKLPIFLPEKNGGRSG